MSIEDLSRNVLALIDAAQSQKQKTATAEQRVADVDADQPRIDELNSKVLAALHELSGAPTTVDTSSNYGDMSGRSPAAQDPNAPVS